MLGRYFKPGVVYADGGHWLRVKTRGPLITRGVDEPIVRMTAADPGGTVYRVWVYARRRYQTAPTFPAAADNGAPEPGRLPYSQPQASVKRNPAPKSQAQPEAAVTGTRTCRKKARAPRIRAAALPSRYSDEACYWLPHKDLSSLSSAQYAVVESLSELLWEDAPARHWSSDGILDEHDVPPGRDAVELTARLHRVERPDGRQVEKVRQILELLVSRGLVEPSSVDRRRFRLHGWQCLHTRRRTTRRAIAHGGGRALFATVRFSA